MHQTERTDYLAEASKPRGNDAFYVTGNVGESRKMLPRGVF